MTMNTTKEQTVTSTILTDMNKLTDVLRGDIGSDYAIGWLHSMVADMAHDPDLKLTKKQVSALEAYVKKNIKWAEEWASRRQVTKPLTY